MIGLTTCSQLTPVWEPGILLAVGCAGEGCLQLPHNGATLANGTPQNAGAGCPAAGLTKAHTVRSLTLGQSCSEVRFKSNSPRYGVHLQHTSQHTAQDTS